MVSIQSQLVFGHAGNSAAMLPLELAGIPVSAVPTVLFSNTPRYASMAGDVIDPEQIGVLLDALLERQPPRRTRAIISGYLGAAGPVSRIARFVEQVKADNADCPYVLDPVIGSWEAGDIADQETFAGIRDTLLPLANLVVPNDYELERLTGLPTRTPNAAKTAAHQLIERGAREVVVTGVGASEADTLDCIAVTEHGAWRVETPRLPVQPVGTGDVVTALYTGARLQHQPPDQALSAAISGVFAAVQEQHARQLYELPLVQLGAGLTQPKRRFEAVAFA